MVSILVLYGTGEGQTAKVAETIAEALEERGHESTVTDVAAESGSVDVDEFDAVLVGASIHVGKQQAAIRTFVTERRDALESRPTGFFQVSLSSATDDEARRAEAAGYVDAFVEETGWQPDRVGLFGGALRYSKYGFLKRLVMKRIAREATGDTDTARDYEYTDWEEVETFANDFAAFVEGRLGVAPPSSE
ncbi:menaquinone-dependent protoporphyrinogen IX dehydrogenase (plasmid) [Haloterrigena salifodinae]|uniref:Menaquinone-dependent protoporphyrinogen IX dehydrogenase n=1 Tax=Haloterrigena salifodinae TaxID=2675099 RepID=A0A8T8E876_9EURY|nr:menaquinone-dependent protoporphyrinogen IX dehydrogenase [Haloterrigena salifodinae]QRV17730.1 menaquinone-dependent protoporphyrinogen IX dehydrogenase [Haloterrigena salifodinae]